jgi:hypothetical protein
MRYPNQMRLPSSIIRCRERDRLCPWPLRALAALEAAHESLQEQWKSLRATLETVRNTFSRDLEKLRETAERAEERLRASEKRALLEIDRERSAVLKAQKELAEAAKPPISERLSIGAPLRRCRSSRAMPVIKPGCCKASLNRALCEPQFEFVTPQQLVAIDFFLSMHHYAPHAFPALAVWHDVNVLGRRYPVPKLADVMPYGVEVSDAVGDGVACGNNALRRGCRWQEARFLRRGWRATLAPCVV